MGTRPARQIPETEIAMALVLQLAEHHAQSFSLMGYYDNDQEFLDNLEERLRVTRDKAWNNKLLKVTRKLVQYGVLYGLMQCTQKEYIGEPAKQMNYYMKPGKAFLLTRGKTEHTQEPEWEAKFLLRRAYPELLESDRLK